MPQPDLRTITSRLSTVDHLRQIHAHLVRRDLHSHDPWLPSLVAMCTRLHAPSLYARRILDSAADPGSTSFTNLLRFYSEFGSDLDVLALFREMQNRSLKLDDLSLYPILVKAAGKSGLLFHSVFIKTGCGHGKYTRNAMINVYGKYGPIKSARQVFDELSESNVPNWNAIISGYWNWGLEFEAKKLFNLMPVKNVITWTAMVTGYSKTNDLESARIYFDMMPEKNIVSWNAMLSGYSQNGFPKLALDLFRDMVSSGVCPNGTTWVNVLSSCSSQGDHELADSVVKMLDESKFRTNLFVKTALLDLYAKRGHLEMARKMFDELGICRNIVAWNSMISAYTRAGDLVGARGLFDQMPKKDVVSWNSMIAGYTQNGQSQLAIELFKEMIEKVTVTPDEVTMASVISACGHLGALALGNWVMEFMTANCIKLSLSIYNSLIFMYSRCGSMDKAQTIFSEMETRDVISYNSLITGFASHGSGTEALKFLKRMKSEGLEPDRITSIGILTACTHSGMLEEGKRFFNSIECPDIDHYGCLVDLLGRVGKLDAAMRVIEEMPMEPSAGIYGSLLNASRIHKRLDLGEFAAHKLLELEPENLGNYILLSNLYASLRKWDNVEKIRQLVRTRGLLKTAGWSRIEHGGEMHEFTAGARSHEQTAEVYRKLAEINSKLRDLGYIPDKGNALRDVEDEEKEEMVGTHSEKLAVAFSLLVGEPTSVVRVVKNLRICLDCHTFMKMISKMEGREIIVRDNNRFHHFKDNACSCNNYW